MDIRRLLFPIILFTLLLTLSACGGDDESNGNDDSEDLNEEHTEEESGSAENEDQEGSEVSVLSFIQEEAVDMDAGDFAVTALEEAPSATNYDFYYASDGTLIMENYENSVWFDYETGKLIEITPAFEDTQNTAYRGRLSLWALSSVHNGFHYFEYFQPTDSATHDHDKLGLYKTDLTTHEMTEIAQAPEGLVSLFEDDILYTADTERMLALDLNTGETLWETENGVGDSWYPKFYKTDNSLIYTNLETVAAYSLEDGELLFEESGLFYDVAPDGENFYVLKNVTDLTGDELQIYSYHESDGEIEAVTAPIEVDDRNNEEEIGLDLVDNQLFIRVSNGMLAYDTDSYNLTWATAAGEIEDVQETGDDSDMYYVYPVYEGNQIYAVTEAFGGAYGEDDKFFTVFDAATGETVEHYLLGKGEVSKPIIDHEAGKVLVYYYDYDADEGHVYTMDL